MDDATTIPALAGLKRFQRFGEHGPAYEILGPGEEPQTVRIHILETREECDYAIAQARDDPPA